MKAYDDDWLEAVAWKLGLCIDDIYQGNLDDVIADLQDIINSIGTKLA